MARACKHSAPSVLGHHSHTAEGPAFPGARLSLKRTCKSLACRRRTSNRDASRTPAFHTHCHCGGACLLWAAGVSHCGGSHHENTTQTMCIHLCFVLGWGPKGAPLETPAWPLAHPLFSIYNSFYFNIAQEAVSPSLTLLSGYYSHPTSLAHGVFFLSPPRYSILAGGFSLASARSGVASARCSQKSWLFT